MSQSPEPQIKRLHQNSQIDTCHSDVQKTYVPTRVIYKTSYPLLTPPSPLLPPHSSLLTLQIDGPFTGSYSLAMVNREMARALEALYSKSVSISFDTHPEGPQDPGPDELAQDTDVARLYRCQRDPRKRWVMLYNSYPPLVLDRPEALSLTNAYGWEESEFPAEFVRGFNTHLQGLSLMSGYVLKVMQDNGVALPMTVVGLGVDHLDRLTSESGGWDLGAGFVFLHVSSGFARKGLDVLLKAYSRAFTVEDAVTLVVKTFPNPQNEAPGLIESFVQDPDFPRVVLINEDVPYRQLLHLYQQADCLVAPSRGEGFGLPMAEAMALNIPVISTAYGGQRDFCTPCTAWLVDYRFEYAATHLSRSGSVWVEPDVRALTRRMRQVYRATPEVRRLRTEAACELVRTTYTWSACARRLGAFIHELDNRPPFTGRIKTGLVSTWNCRCGIAEYSRYLLPHLLPDLEVTVLAANFTEAMRADEPNVQRMWNKDNFHTVIPQVATDMGITWLVINFHFGFFRLTEFQQLLIELKNRHISCVVIFHSTQSAEGSLAFIRQGLKTAVRLLVHTAQDLNRFKCMGLVPNVALLPHGTAELPPHCGPSAVLLPRPLRHRRLIATFGFLMPHKGVLELIRAFARLLENHSDLGLLLLTSLYPKDGIQAYYEECLEAIAALQLEEAVHFMTDFQPLEDTLRLLRRAELVVYPYQFSDESSSAAVRMGLGADRPVACTPLNIFADVQHVVEFFSGVTPPDLARGIHDLLSSPQQLHAKDTLRRQWLDVHGWPGVGYRLRGLIRGLEAERQ